MREINESMPSGNYIKIIDKLPRNSIAILTQLRTGHAPLNNFLHKIKRSNDPTCHVCEMERETVKHLLIRCPRYDHMRLKLQQHYRQRDLLRKTLLSNPKTLKMLFEFLNEMERFKATYGVFTTPKQEERRQKDRGGRERERVKRQ